MLLRVGYLVAIIIKIDGPFGESRSTYYFLSDISVHGNIGMASPMRLSTHFITLEYFSIRK